ncbi:hypothetical protein [Roseovarius phycicola]|uniref:Uncharacterized protein n=1 Tax=Roseovarius phycicola TaxID=3080976 RepID=A0ABZ2HF70_9RHOB
MTSNSEVLVVVRASPGRRVLGVGALALLGLLAVYVAMARPPGALLWQMFLVVIGGLALWMADAMRRATALAVELTREGLRTSDGEMIARLEDIDSLDRGIFAFKPSNGFLIKLKQKAPARWRPGLWWRMGKRVGIGGVTPGAQSRAMADIVTALIRGDIELD